MPRVGARLGRHGWVWFGLLAACGGTSTGEPQKWVTTRSGTAQGKIVFGTAPVKPHDDAVVALVLRGSGGKPFCSGTLIGPKLVVTAAHCVEIGYDGNNGAVFFGDALAQPLENNGQLIEVAKAVSHPQFDSNILTFDIGLVALKEAPVGVMPIPHLVPALKLTADDEGKTLRLAGFGLTEEPFLDDNSPFEMRAKLQTEVTIAKVCSGNSFCNWAVSGGLVPHAVAYDFNGSGMCSGDSGGPAFFERDGVEYVAGANSYIMADALPNGQPDCVTEEGGAETMLSYYDDYIAEFAQDQGLTVTADSCISGKVVCDPLARCEVKNQAYECVCPAGYASDDGGQHCNDIDECTTGQLRCAAEAGCKNLPGSAECNPCPSGYTDVNNDGTKCVASASGGLNGAGANGGNPFVTAPMIGVVGCQSAPRVRWDIGFVILVALAILGRTARRIWLARHGGSAAGQQAHGSGLFR
jgi:hypothetical protein